MSISWETGDLRKLAADLGDSDDRVGKEVAQTLRKHGKALKAKAQALAPVRTGALKAGWVEYGGGDGRSGDMSVGIRNSTRQGFFQEHGTSKHPPQPSGGPALEAVAPAFVADMERMAAEKLLP